MKDIPHGTTYRFSLSSCNFAGQSKKSEWSDPIDIGNLLIKIDTLVPAIESIELNILTPESFQVIFPSIDSSNTPPLKGFKIMWSTNSNMTESKFTSELIGLDKVSYIVNKLERGSI
jgi:hypothetical protein